jgi:hypothetical protein
MPLSCRNVLDVTSIMFMLVIIPLHFARAGDKEGSVLAPLIAFEVIMTWFKVSLLAARCPVHTSLSFTVSRDSTQLIE